MLYLTVFVGFLALAHGLPRPSVPMLDGRIVGGEQAHIEEVPYQAALLLDNKGTGEYTQACGGSIISRTTIVTAAHCTDGTRASQWKIRVGSSFHNQGGQVVSVIQYIQHESFNSRFDNDISLLHLSAALTLESAVATITLPSQGSIVVDEASALVTGWGTTSEGGSRPTELRKVTIPIVNQEQCANAYSFVNPITDNMICAGIMGIGGKDACQGDSGGPLTINRILIGITSWGLGCAHPSYPGVYTRVPMFRNWINSNM